MKSDSITEKRTVCLSAHLLVMALLIVSFPFCQTKAQPKVVINEVMQSNVDFMMLDHDLPDSWVELYNGSDTRIQVNNYRIGTTNVFSEGFRLSNTLTYIEPGGHIVLYCDKTTAAPFHYNFNLEAGNGQIFLFTNDGMPVDSLYYDEMPAPNVAFGRITDGSDEWQYELSPTPGAANNSVGSSELLPECGLTYCTREMYVDGKLSSRLRALPSDDFFFDLVTHRRDISSGTLMVRREVWQQLNGFNESLRRHQDYEFTARVARFYPILPLDFIGLRKYMLGRNNAGDSVKAFELRKQYIASIEPLMTHFTAKQRRKVIEENHLALAMKAFFKGDIKAWWNIYRYVKPGLWGYTYMFRYALKAIKKNF